jgi:hypothetical protein
VGVISEVRGNWGQREQETANEFYSGKPQIDISGVGVEDIGKG